jgi:hypothetical protein
MARQGGRSTDAAWQNTNEAGVVLGEALIALTLLVILMMAMTGIFMFCMRAYFYHLADGELVQEVQGAFSVMVEDVLVGQYIMPGDENSAGFYIIGRQNPLHTDSQPDGIKKESYWLHNMAGLLKLVRGTVDAPITGDHSLARVTIVEFSAVKDEHYPHVYKIRLTGRSEITNHEYTMCTAVYLPPL